MQNGAAHAERMAFRKHGLKGNAAVHESNAAKRLRIRVVQGNAETAQHGQTIGHQSFTAYFVDRRARAIGKCDMQSPVARGDGRSQPGGSPSNDE
jgi:hypothetical protein